MITGLREWVTRESLMTGCGGDGDACVMVKVTPLKGDLCWGQ
jgi:hypothetical protein